ncbi:MAG: DUF2231 domain-containing protein [Campylobacterota bacterium]|nr:DUF2231 domain-containing protein [Campylobacterota bacterium]
MQLPDISIPKAVIDSIPMELVPALIHPPLVHFAIVLPIIIVLLEIVNIIVKRGETPEEPKGRGVSTLSFLLIVAMVVIFAAAYISGSVDGKAAWDTLGDAGQAELKEHKLLGIYLVYGSLALFLFKIISFSGGKARLLFLILAIVFAAATINQGKDGGELVYEHGANVAKVKVLDDKVFDLEEEIDSLKEELAKEEPVMKDSVATKEAKAIANPEPVAGEAEAKAKVEESESKDQFEAKEASESFKAEDAADEQKVATEAEVQTIETEDKTTPVESNQTD